MPAKKKEVFEILTKIPRGKVLTYKELAKIASLNSPRVVGNYLHTNSDSENFPCHRVVHSDGSLAKGFAFGGEKAQKEKLLTEKVVFKHNKVDLTKSLWRY